VDGGVQVYYRRAARTKLLGEHLRQTAVAPDCPTSGVGHPPIVA